jgi:hypothetical protein
MCSSPTLAAQWDELPMHRSAHARQIAPRVRHSRRTRSPCAAAIARRQPPYPCARCVARDSACFLTASNGWDRVGHGELTGTVAVVRLDPTVLLAALRATAAEAHARRSARSARLVARARNGKERKEMGSKWVGGGGRDVRATGSSCIFCLGLCIRELKCTLVAF